MLKLSHLTKVYREKGESVRALDDVTLSFPEKGMVFVLGKSGCGKSTLLNLTGGLDSPTSGEIFINGRSSGDFSPTDYDGYRNSCVGFIFQEYNLLDEFTVGQNVSLALQLQGVKDLRSAVENALRRVGLEGFADRKPNTLSGGQKQRVAIARALVKDPQIVLADEPTGALDSETGGEILATLKELSEDKLVVVVTHDREFAEEYGDRIIELKDGKVISDTEKAAPAAEEGKGGFKQVPSRLPMARAIRMGAASLRVKPFRLVLTVLLSFVSFVLFGWASTMMLYNRRSVLVNSYYESGNPYVRLEKSYTFRSTDLLTNETQEKSVEGAPMGNREIAALEEGAVGIYGVKSTSVSNLIVSGV